MLAFTERNRVLRYALAMLAVALATVARLATGPATGARAPFFFFAAAVVLVSWVCGFGPGVLTVLLGAVAGTWILFESNSPSSPRDFILPATFCLLAFLFNWIIGQMHKANKGLRDSARAFQVANQQLQKAQEDLLVAKERLEQSNDDLQRFAYATTHDLQEPLRMVSLYSQLLVRENQGRLNHDTESFAKCIEDSVNRMFALIEGILEFSRVNSGSDPAAAPVPADEALQSALRMLDGAIRESGARIHAGDLPLVLADPRQLARVFQNLIGNALKYRGATPPEISISAVPSGGFWTFSVRDNGIGIDPKYHDQIFDIFRRLHSAEEYPGTGIGLAISKRIIERNGGRIWVESAAGQGATFHFTVPVAMGVKSPRQIHAELQNQ